MTTGRVLVAVLVAGCDRPPGQRDAWHVTVTLEEGPRAFDLKRRNDSLYLRMPDAWMPWTPKPEVSGRAQWMLPDSVATVTVTSSPAGAVEVEVRDRRSAVLPVTVLRDTGGYARQVEFIVDANGVRVAGTASIPSTRGPWPVAIVLHGGGNSSREDSPPYRFWMEYLADRGYYTLGYDKRGNGGSTGSWRTVGFDERAADVRALIDWAEAQSGVAPSSVLLFSVSQGAWVATRVATTDDRVGALIQVSGAAATPRAADTHASQVAWRRRSLGSGAIATLSRLWELEVDAALHADSVAHWDRYNAAVAAARRAPWWTSADYGVLAPSDWFAGWYPRVATYDPSADIASLRVPVLWLLGAHDTQLDGPASAEKLGEIARASGAPLSVRLFPNADHGIFAPVDPLGRPIGVTRAADGFFEAIDAFLSRLKRELPLPR